MFIPDSTLLTLGEIWDEHENFKPLLMASMSIMTGIRHQLVEAVKEYQSINDQIYLIALAGMEFSMLFQISSHLSRVESGNKMKISTPTYDAVWMHGLAKSNISSTHAEPGISHVSFAFCK